MDQDLLRQTSLLSWDMQRSSVPHFPCFQFISDRLGQSKVYVTFVLMGNEPFCIPAWPISRATHSKVIRTFRKACEIFPTVPQWVARVATSSADRSKIGGLKVQTSDAYLIRRSLIQHEIIFSGEGMTMLTADHIYTFKRCLSALSDHDLPATVHKRCIMSCVHLLRRINTTYTGVKLSKSYLERAYDMHLETSALKEVHQMYLGHFCESGIQDMTVGSDNELPRLPELESPTEQRAANLLPTIDMEAPATDLRTYEPAMSTEPSEAWESDIWSPCRELTVDVTYPRVPALTKLPDFPSPVSTPPSLSGLTTTICSRCLVGIEKQEIICKQKMTTFLSPEWEDFRRIGLGILRC